MALDTPQGPPDPRRCQRARAWRRSPLGRGAERSEDGGRRAGVRVGVTGAAAGAGAERQPRRRQTVRTATWGRA